MRRPTLLLVWLVLACLAAAPAAAGEVAGFVREVRDGTSFVLDDGTLIHLWGVAGPALNQTCRNAGGTWYGCGRRSRAALEDLVGDRLVQCQEKVAAGRDLYAQCRADDMDVAAALVAGGHAIGAGAHDPRGPYRAQEAGARNRRLGLWSGSFSIAGQSWHEDR